MRGAESQYNCVGIKPGINFKKRDEVCGRAPGVVEVGECEGSLARPILAKIAAQQGLLEEALDVHRINMDKALGLLSNSVNSEQ